MRYWLFKSEPDVFGYDDLAAKREGEHWDGVRNYQARNLLRDEIAAGDTVLFYHSSTKPPHVAGVCEVTRSGYPDPTQFDPEASYYDPKSTAEAPRWYVVDVRAVRRLPATVTLAELKANPALADMALLRRGNRLSVMEITPDAFEEIVRMSHDKHQAS